MSIECYYKECKYHCRNTLVEEIGPFCDETECKATHEELAKFEVFRQFYLNSIKEVHS